MLALEVGSSFAIAALLYNNAVSATLAFRRQGTESDLNPWVSVDASGNPLATITPVLTTISGIATTISPIPANLPPTATSAKENNASPTSDAGAGPTATGGGSFQVCHNKAGDFAPFCEPTNGSSVYVGEKYYVTWDTTFFTLKNASVIIQGNYVNASGGGPQAFEAAPIENHLGYLSWSIEKEWLKEGKYSNNVTLFILPNDPNANEPQTYQGPTVMVTNRKPEIVHQLPPKLPSGQALYIALPSIFGFVLLCVCGGFIINRKQHKIGLGNVMGRRKGYGTGKSKMQRLGLGKKKAAAIKLREQQLTAGGQYRDKPEDDEARGHARADSDQLGSLAGTPTEERTNYFRGEMARGEQGRF